MTPTLWIIISSIIGLVPVSSIILMFVTAHIIFLNTLYVDPKKEKKREFTVVSKDKDNPIQLAQEDMFNIGTEWANQFKDKIHDLHMVNDSLNLYAQYVDFGHDKCAIIIQGRTESLLYSYYFAKPYADNGYNILVIDTRGHGLSEGKYLTAGVLDSKDVVKWIDLVSSQFNINNFLIHGICVGAAVGVLAFNEFKKRGGDNPIKKLVFDGAYPSYYSIFRQHHIEKKKPVWPFIHLVFFIVWLRTGARLGKNAPIKQIKHLDPELPILFMYSKQDFYVLPQHGQKLFDACPSQNKQIKFLDIGRHSHVRYNQTGEYDGTIENFLIEN